MNRYLLDTHILLWWLSDDKKLSKKNKDIITKSSTNIIVSTVSIWEIVIKKTLKKLESPDNIKEILYKNDFEILPITADHVLYLEQLPFIHHDPFDRLLIAQSIVEKATFITADTIIPKYGVDCF